MPEGPSIVLAKEDLSRFAGRTVRSATGTATIDMKKFRGSILRETASWGKHLLLVFDGFFVRVHFLMFGKYLVNARREVPHRLRLRFAGGGEINFYTCSVVMADGSPDDVYRWDEDVMAEHWNTRGVRARLKKIPNALICDALMDQSIFPGLGNIMKNEVLYRTQIHPASVTGSIPPEKLTQLIKCVRSYAFQFLEQRRQGTLKKNWQVYARRQCRRDDAAIVKAYPGVTARRSFFCSRCQVLYS